MRASEGTPVGGGRVGRAAHGWSGWDLCLCGRLERWRVGDAQEAAEWGELWGFIHADWLSHHPHSAPPPLAYLLPTHTKPRSITGIWALATPQPSEKDPVSVSTLFLQSTLLLALLLMCVLARPPCDLGRFSTWLWVLVGSSSVAVGWSTSYLLLTELKQNSSPNWFTLIKKIYIWFFSCFRLSGHTALSLFAFTVMQYFIDILGVWSTVTVHFFTSISDVPFSVIWRITLHFWWNF